MKTISVRRTAAIAVAALGLCALVACASETPSTASAKEPTTSGPSCDPKVGAPAPKLTLQAVNTKTKVTIAPGKVTLVDFWATWCGPCKKSFPAYQALYTKYKASGFELIAVSSDDEDADIAGFAKGFDAKFPVGLDKGHTIAGCWKPLNMPTAYLIDKKGIVRQIHNKWENGDEKELEAQIKSLL